MANYNSVEDIISAGITNMQELRNSQNDDGVDTCNGVSWFIFNNVVANNIYVSGNTWFGIGTNAEQLKVNRRDTKIYYLYREEGTLYEYYHFLKFRWKGYSHYNTTSSTAALEYDVILWDTGDISVHMVTIPTAYNDGTYSLTEGGTTYTYSVSVSAPDVTFYKNGSSRNVENSLINLRIPFDKKFLIRNNGVLYDTEGVTLATQTLNAAAFENYGSDTAPTQATLENFTNPEILLWHDSEDYAPQIIVNMEAVPFPQVLISNDYDMTDETILGIEDADIVASSDILFAISFDSGTTWKAYSAGAWVTLNSSDSGMNAETFNSISVEAWATVAASAEHLRIRAYLPALTSYIETIIINFIN